MKKCLFKTEIMTVSKELRISLVFSVHGIQWLKQKEKELMTGNNLFTRIENLFDKIHSHSNIQLAYIHM